MLIEEVFQNIISHLLKGVLFHDEMAAAFEFLNLRGYAKCQEYHFLEESYNYKCLQNFFIYHYGKMVNKNVEKVELLPEKWYKAFSTEVDTNNKKSVVKELFKKWIEWEKETKILLENCYKQLYETNEIDYALMVGEFIREVSDELAEAQYQQISLENINYDMVHMIEEQSSIYKKYQKEIKKIYKDDVE